MSKKILVAFVTIMAGLLLASGAMAGYPDESLAVLNLLTTDSGNTAGTILNPEGKGDVLIFPYYDVRDVGGKPQVFHIFIINDDKDCLNNDFSENTTECYAGVAAKLRFREWDKSEEVFDVDIWLSRGDVWYGRVSRDPNVAYPYGAKIVSSDYVITDYSDPSFNPDNNPSCSFGAFTVAPALAGGIDFPLSAYIPGPTNPPWPKPVAVNSPGSDNMMGYIEVIGEENTFDHLFTEDPIAKVFRQCEQTHARDARNTLMGFAYLVNVPDGVSFAYNATAIANFSVHQGTLFDSPGGTLPGFLQAEDTLDEVEFQLSKNELVSGYDVEDFIAGKFSMIVSFPTKHFHFCGKPNYTRLGDTVTITDPNCLNITYPIGSPWTAAHANAPEKVAVTIWDRDERFLTPPTSFISPKPPASTLGLPYEVNVIGLYKSGPPTAYPKDLTIRDTLTFPTFDQNGQLFDSGYIRLLFPNAAVVAPTNRNPIKSAQAIGQFLNFGWFHEKYFGLPVLGLGLQQFTNGNVGGAYGAILESFYEREWDAPVQPIDAD